MASGPELSFDELYRDYSERVYRYCYRLCGNSAEEAQDVAQETFILAYGALHQFEGRASVLTWLFRIAKRVRTRHAARTIPTVPLELTAELVDSEGDPAPVHVRRMWLEAAMSRLPEHLREALVLVKAEGLTYREAAAVLEVPQGTVQFHVSQALKQMRKLLSEELGVPGALSVLTLLLLQRELRAEVPVPRELTERVYQEIGRECPPDLLGAPSGRGRRRGGATGIGVPQAGRRWIVAAVLVLLGLLVAGWWLQGPPPPMPGTPLGAVFQAMARVPSAHVTGSGSRHLRYRNGRVEPIAMQLEYWFKLPNRYRAVNKERRSSELFTEGAGQATEVLISGTRPVTIPVNRGRARTVLAGFEFFTPDGMLIRQVRNNMARVTGLRSELESREVDLITVESRDGEIDHRWELYADLQSHRVLRSEYRREKQSGSVGEVLFTFTLERFEYEIGIPDRLFDPAYLTGAFP